MPQYDLSKQSLALSAFYMALGRWLETGEQPGGPHSDFYDRTGLCGQLEAYSGIYTSDRLGERRARRKLFEEMGFEMERQFTNAGLSSNFPFNGSMASYQDDRLNGTMYQNQARLAWIRDHLITA